VAKKLGHFIRIIRLQQQTAMPHTKSSERYQSFELRASACIIIMILDYLGMLI
jgi:hypothetical protein